MEKGQYFLDPSRNEDEDLQNSCKRIRLVQVQADDENSLQRNQFKSPPSSSVSSYEMEIERNRDWCSNWWSRYTSLRNGLEAANTHGMTNNNDSETWNKQSMELSETNCGMGGWFPHRFQTFGFYLDKVEKEIRELNEKVERAEAQNKSLLAEIQSLEKKSESREEVIDKMRKEHEHELHEHKKTIDEQMKKISDLEENRNVMEQKLLQKIKTLEETLANKEVVIKEEKKERKRLQFTEEEKRKELENIRKQFKTKLNEHEKTIDKQMKKISDLEENRNMQEQKLLQKIKTLEETHANKEVVIEEEKKERKRLQFTEEKELENIIKQLKPKLDEYNKTIDLQKTVKLVENKNVKGQKLEQQQIHKLKNPATNLGQTPANQARQGCRKELPTLFKITRKKDPKKQKQFEKMSLPNRLNCPQSKANLEKGQKNVFFRKVLHGQDCQDPNQGKHSLQVFEECNATLSKLKSVTVTRTNKSSKIEIIDLN